MAFEGELFSVRYGSGGLHTDDPHGLIPPQNLTRAINVNLEHGRLRKAGGSTQWNATTVLSSPIVRFFDWHPDDNTQRVIAVTRDGKVYRFKDAYNFSEVLPSGGAPAALNVSEGCMILEGGEEEANNAKKLFILTGNDPIQVISGDGITRADISKPAADWSGRNQPFFAIIHRTSLVAFGNKNNPHRGYFSLGTDQEDFTTTPLQFQIYPGVSKKLMSAFIYKKRLFFAKNPLGVYMLNDTDPTVANWSIDQTHKSFGVASPMSIVPAIDDVVVANSYGGLTSVLAAERTDDIKAGDIFSELKNQEYVDNEISQSGILERECIYYGNKRRIYASFRSAGNFKNDRICRIDLSKQGSIVTWYDKDQPTCLGLIKDIHGVDRPAYGADDGFIYLLDQPDFNVGGNAYRGEFWTPNMDFGTSDLLKSEMVKNYQHLEIVYEATGTFDLTVEVFIDLSYSETKTFSLVGNSHLGTLELDDSKDGRLYPVTQLSQRLEIGGEGRRIMLKCYNEGNGESFIINGFNIYYEESSQQQLII